MGQKKSQKALSSVFFYVAHEALLIIFSILLDWKTGIHQ